ncbi:glycosyltransferase family 2 protein [Campylobacter sp. MG1]|uniref:glycosyltransferase family 2 protein n=1 Tax=Campylobacter sp. MG1 TaxID=2976332 RepID=UPI00226C84C7|nr:glycosyltransferase family 2 protein [Campylobacter sp. MG1]
MPLISIILPTYNVEKYIARALESCINQTLKDIEIIVVDDKGQDKSIDIAKEFANRDDRIIIVHNKENLKLLHARAEGVKVATSDLIMFLDPDDELELNACEIAYRAMVDGGGYIIVDMLCFNFCKITNKDKVFENIFIDNIYKTKDFIQYIININKCYWNLCNKVFKKSLYLNILKFNLKNIIMAEDALCFFILLNYTNTIKTLKNNLYLYYQNNLESSTITNNLLKIEHALNDEKYVINIINDFNTIDINMVKLKNNILKKLKNYHNERKMIYYNLKFPYIKSIIKIFYKIIKK